jgi:hypothetical protein
MTRRKFVALSVCFLCLVGSLVPFDTVFVPEWKLRLVDENGNPWRGQYVAQYCTNYTLGIHPCEDQENASQITDQDGVVLFPERRIRANLLYRIFRPVFGLFLLLLNGEYGENGYLSTSGPYGSQVIRFEPDGPLPIEIVISAPKS